MQSEWDRGDELAHHDDNIVLILADELHAVAEAWTGCAQLFWTGDVLHVCIRTTKLISPFALIE